MIKLKLSFLKILAMMVDKKIFKKNKKYKDNQFFDLINFNVFILYFMKPIFIIYH